MSGSNWGNLSKIGFGLAVVFAAGFAILFWREASNESEQASVHAEQQRSQHANAARVKANIECARIASPSREICKQQRQQRARPDERDEQDLEAQRVMAAWTKAMGKSAVVGMFVGILGVGLIWVTFRETKRTADETAKNAQAFIEAERAILHAIGGSVGTSSKDGREIVCIEIENKGRSAGRVIEISADAVEGLGDNKAERWTTIEAGGKAMVPAFAPPQRGETLKTKCFIKYRTIGQREYTSHFSATIYYKQGDRYSEVVTIPHWVVDVPEKQGHPDDT